jgi:hypothetical protein
LDNGAVQWDGLLIDRKEEPVIGHIDAAMPGIGKLGGAAAILAVGDVVQEEPAGLLHGILERDGHRVSDRRLTRVNRPRRPEGLNENRGGRFGALRGADAAGSLGGRKDVLRWI